MEFFFIKNGRSFTEQNTVLKRNSERQLTAIFVSTMKNVLTLRIKFKTPEKDEQEYWETQRITDIE